MTSYENLLIEERDSIAFVTVNRPKVLNALNGQTVRELDACFAELEARESVRGILLTGSGEKAFVAGADINELAQQSVLEGKENARLGQRAFERIANGTKPTIAAINGFALGGGLELALACTLRTASETAKLGLPEVQLGIIPGYGGTQRLARLAGMGVALEWILTGDHVSAQEAHRVGVVNRVFAPAELMEGSEKLLRTILSRGPIAIAMAMEAVRRGLDGTLADGLRTEADLFGLISSTADMREGMTAFLEKRRAAFRNC
ncbi:MAG: enoyl-CoA hydratase/isomerase family protein [Planctomycetes bacterium]|nr:enoyl-CoA hydratase/isomerase family protein [Planctomycetota bacterium]